MPIRTIPGPPGPGDISADRKEDVSPEEQQGSWPGLGPAHEGINSYSAQEGINSKTNIIPYLIYPLFGKLITHICNLGNSPPKAPAASPKRHKWGLGVPMHIQFYTNATYTNKS